MDIFEVETIIPLLLICLSLFSLLKLKIFYNKLGNKIIANKFPRHLLCNIRKTCRTTKNLIGFPITTFFLRNYGVVNLWVTLFQNKIIIEIQYDFLYFWIAKLGFIFSSISNTNITNR